MLGCDAGCHGVQFGARSGGGYYAYVASKFPNTLLVVDADPNNDGDVSDATIAGRILLTATSATAKDDTITGNACMGGQDVCSCNASSVQRMGSEPSAVVQGPPD